MRKMATLLIYAFIASRLLTIRSVLLDEIMHRVELILCLGLSIVHGSIALILPSLNAPVALPSIHNITTNLTAVHPDDAFCHNSNLWRGSVETDWRMRIDCEAAIKYLEAFEVNQHRDTKFEFRNSTTPSRYDYPIMRSPRRYIYSEHSHVLKMSQDR